MEVKLTELNLSEIINTFKKSSNGYFFPETFFISQMNFKVFAKKDSQIL